MRSEMRPTPPLPQPEDPAEDPRGERPCGDPTPNGPRGTGAKETRAVEPGAVPTPTGGPSNEATTAEVEQQSFENRPLTRPEYFFAVSHFYRGEVDRANTWRVRIDSTTNWAVATAAAFAGFTLSHPEVPHVVVLFGNLVVFSLLWIETRRFRLFDVFRVRVRGIEENFFAPVLTRDLDSRDSNWGSLMATHCLKPRFRNSYWEVMGLRLRRNYMFLFLSLLFTWLVKIFVLPGQAAAGADSSWLRRIEVLGVPAWIVLPTIMAFYGFLTLLLIATRSKRRHRTGDWGSGRKVKWYDV